MRRSPSPPVRGALSLAGYPGDIVRFACTRCPRKGQYAKATLIALHGAGMSLPDLRLRVAHDCPKAANRLGIDPCGVFYPDLIRE